MATLPSIYTSTETVTAMQNAAADSSNDYKAIICFFMYGGMDSHNMLIPSGSNTNLAVYNAARAEGVRIEQNEVLSLSDNPNWSLHPKLDFLRYCYNNSTDNHLAILRNVGTLDRPITKTEYQQNPKVAPDQIFGHNIQQDIWQAALAPDVPRTSGWFGRMANLMDPYFNGSQFTPSGVLSTTGNAIQNVAILDTPPSIIPPVQMAYLSNGAFGTPSSGANATLVTQGNLMRHDNVATRTSIGVRNMMYEAYGAVLTGAIDRQNALANTTTGLIDLPSSDSTAIDTATPTIGTSANRWRAAVKNVCRAILSRTSDRLNQRRQIFFVGVGGWDHHSNLRSQQDVMLEQFDDALNALTSRLAAYGLSNNVVMFTETEFSRTLTSNATGGTDHAWAGHSFILGGPVVNGLYGPEPVYTLNGTRDLGSGRYIPDISTEQYFATIAKWFGVPTAQLPIVLPNLQAYSPQTLGFLP